MHNLVGQPYSKHICFCKIILILYFIYLKTYYILGSSKFFRRSSTTVTDTFKRSTASIKRKLFFNSGTFNSNGSVVHNRPLALKASEINSQDCEIAKRLSKQILLLCLFIYREEFLVYLAHQSIDVTMMHFLEFPRIYRKKRLDG